MKKKNLGEQIADELIHRIAVGYYSHVLPGEVPLAAEMDVSRTALRAGLARLQKTGLISKEKGAPSRINAEHIALSASATREVVLLFNDIHPTVQSNSVLVLLQKELLVEGIHVECITGKRFSSRRLRTIVDARPDRVYGLIGSTSQLQSDFAALGLPAVVIGTSSADNALPCVDANYRPIASHAVGLLRSHGWQRILMVTPGGELPGDAITLSAMQAATAAAAMPMDVLEVKQPTRFAGRLATAVKRSPLRTAVFVSRPAKAIDCLVSLLGKGLQVPKDVGLLSRDYLPLFDSLSPIISCYDCKIDTIVRRAAHTLSKMTRSQPIHGSQLLVIPEYRPGATL